MEIIGNGLGPEIEQIPKIIPMLKACDRIWMRRVLTLGLRNADVISADRFDFTHAASIELEMNRNAFACAHCQQGICLRPQHVANDCTYTNVVWSVITYANTDHMEGN